MSKLFRIDGRWWFCLWLCSLSNWLDKKPKKKEQQILSMKKENKCFQYAVTVALNYKETKKNAKSNKN